MAKEVRKQILVEKDICLRQQAKLFWFPYGNRNLKFFHNSIKARRRQNCITKIMIIDGQLSTGSNVIADTIRNYFNELFSEVASNSGSLIELVQLKIGVNENKM